MQRAVLVTRICGFACLVLASAVLFPMPPRVASASPLGRAVREALEQSAKRADEIPKAAKHFDDLAPDERIDGARTYVAEKAAKATVRSLQNDGERKSTFTFIDVCGVIGVMFLVTAMYLAITSKPRRNTHSV